MVFGDWFSVAREIVAEPHAFFARVQDHDGLKEPLIFAIIGSAILSVLQAIIYTGFGRMVLADVGPVTAATDAAMQAAIGVVVSPIAVPVGLLIGGAVMHGFLFLLGARGLKKTVQVMAYTSGAFALLGWVPLVNILFGLYMLYVYVIGFKTLHRLSTARVVIAMLLPILILIGLVIAAAGTFWFSQLALTEQQQSMEEQTRQQLSCSFVDLVIVNVEYQDGETTILIRNAGTESIEEIRILYGDTGDLQQTTVGPLDPGSVSAYTVDAAQQPATVRAEVPGCPQASVTY